MRVRLHLGFGKLGLERRPKFVDWACKIFLGRSEKRPNGNVDFLNVRVKIEVKRGRGSGELVKFGGKSVQTEVRQVKKSRLIFH